MLRARMLAWLIVTAGALSACGGGGDSSMPTPPAPTAIPENLTISAPAAAESATAVAFGNSASALNGLKFQWDFGDGTSSTDPAPSHSFANGGEFEVVLKVSNSAGTTRETRTKVAVTNIANVRGLECSGAASTGWCWQNPRPTGNRVNTVFFLNSTTGWRGGENGEIFKTTDGGVTWLRQNTGIAAGIFGIRFINASTGWATGAYGAVLRTTDGGTTWSLSKVADMQSGSADIATITAVDAKTVYLGRTASNGNSSYSALYASKDGGATWQTLTAAPHQITATGKFWGLQNTAVTVSKDGGQSYSTMLNVKLPAGSNYFDTLNLWALDDQRAVAYSRASALDSTTFQWRYRETFYVTTDGGATWATTAGGSTNTSNGFERVLNISNDGKTLLASTYNTLARSIDGGNTWVAVAGPPSDDYGTSYAPLTSSEVVASSYGGVWLSKDGGSTWTKMANPNAASNSGPNFTAGALRRVDAGTLLVTDNQGATHLSRDDGQTWVRVLAPLDINGQSSVVAFSDAKNGFMVDANGGLFTTKNGGATWEPKTLSLGAVRGVQFVSKQTGWLLSGDGKLYKTTDGGTTWASTSATAAYHTGLYFQSETLGWAQRSYGGAPFAYTRDGGKTWIELALPYGVNSMRQGEQSWVAVGNAGAVYTSTDAGITWNAVYTGTLANLTALAFSDAKTVWALGDNTLLKSDDAGARWTTIKLPGASGTLRDIKFVNAKVGWIVGDNGLILATQDGGITWRAQASGTANMLTSVQVVDAKTAWVTGSYGLVLATGSGGN